MLKKQAMKSKKVNIGVELRRLGVLVEHSNDKWDMVAEQYGGIKKALDDHSEMIGKLMVDTSIIKDDLEFVKHSLKRKVDVDEFSALEKRVLLLEKKSK